MSTRSTIAIEDTKTKEIKSVYSHFDGYLNGVGKCLITHYTEKEQVEQLLKSDISSIGENPESTKYYASNCEPVKYKNEYVFMYDLKNESCLEYIYLFRGGEWFFSETRSIYFDDNEKQQLVLYKTPNMFSDIKTIKTVNTEDLYEGNLTFHTKFKKVKDYLEHQKTMCNE